MVLDFCGGLLAESDPRPLVQNTARSASDAPSALTYNLPTLYEGIRGNEHIMVDDSRLMDIESGDGLHPSTGKGVGGRHLPHTTVSLMWTAD